MAKLIQSDIGERTSTAGDNPLESIWQFSLLRSEGQDMNISSKSSKNEGRAILADTYFGNPSPKTQKSFDLA